MMKRFSFLLILFQMTLFGYEYDKLLLQAQAHIFPKLVLLDQDISKKVLDKEIIFNIVYHPSDYIKSKQIKKMIEEKFGNSVENYKLKLVLKAFNEIKSDDRANAYYILQGSSKQVKRICDIAQERKVPTFTYDPLYFKDGALLSLVMHNESTIYLNKKVHKSYGINFVDIFYQIVRFSNE